LTIIFNKAYVSNVLPRLWSTARTVLAVGGLTFAVLELASACLDHVGENIGTCTAGASDSGADCGAATTPAGGSGSGTGTSAH